MKANRSYHWPALCAITGGCVAMWGACSDSTSSPPLFGNGGAGGATATGGSTTTNTGSSTTAGGTSTTSSVTTSTGGAGGADSSGTGGAGGVAGSSTGSGGATAGSAGTGGGAAGSAGAGGSKAGGAGAGGSTAGAGGAGGAPPGDANVTQFHKNLSRDGHYVDAAFTKARAAMIHKDTTFTAPMIQGPTFAQPLYFEGAAGGKNLVIVVTSQNNIYALDAANGGVVWQKQIAMPAPANSFSCGGMMGNGIVGTPVIDAATKTMYFDAAETGPIRKIHALSLDDGAPRGTPVDVVANVRSGATTFLPAIHSQRAAPTLVGGKLYVPYGGRAGDCGNYRGWVAGISITPTGALDSAGMGVFVTGAPRGGGIWGPGGLASDGTSIYAATGNTFNVTASNWGHGEAILKLAAGPTFTNAAANYFMPSNWVSLDGSDTDLGGSGPVLVDVPGATPSQLVVALGKNGVIYLINRANLGGLGTGNGTTGEAVASARVASGSIIQAAAAYTTAQGTYVVFKGTGMGCPAGQSGNLVAVKISAASPPAPTVAWCANPGGNASPMVTTTDGRSEPIVWTLSGNNLRGYDGDTGAAVFGGGGAGDTVTTLSQWVTPMAARGRIFVASNSNVYAFTMQ
jgi:hypothetical protein